MKPPTLRSLLKAAKRVRPSLPATLNPVNSLTKLMTSHKLDATAPALSFLQSMAAPDTAFFATENMPPNWSVRSYGTAVEAITAVLQHDAKLRKRLADDVDPLIAQLQAKKRHFMAQAKKATRDRQKRVVANAAAAVPAPAPTPTPKAPKPIRRLRTMIQHLHASEQDPMKQLVLQLMKKEVRRLTHLLAAT